MRVASLIPSATEIVCALGMEDALVLRSHECDHPPGVERLPFATKPRYGLDGGSYRIDERVRAILQEGLSVYRVDADRLREAHPDLIVTQDQCRVCAVGLDEIRAAAARLLEVAPEIVSLSPTSLEGVLGDMERVAEALGVPERGRALVRGLRELMERVAARVAGRPRPRVAVIEWLDPLMVAGNWIPELVALAGGDDVLGRPGEHSPFLDWDRIREAAPEVLVVAPCGFTLERTRDEGGLLRELDGWDDVPAVREGRVYLADGHHYLNRPGPRVAECVEILAEVFHGAGAGPAYEGKGWEELQGPG